MRRDRVLQIGGYRPYFRYRGEEEDLAMRLFRAGLKILYRPGVRFVHRHSGAARDDREYAYLSARNTFLLYALNYPWPIASGWGALKAASVIVKCPSHRTARLAGLLNGGLTWLVHASDWTPFSWRQWAAYRRLRRGVAARIRACAS
jgi:GT2 family glycosyltransferase